MNSFTQSIQNIFRGAVKAVETFPASILSALAFAVVTMVRIQLDWPQQEPYNFLFNCLHWSFALGAIFSLSAITIAQSRFNTKKAFLIANLLGAAVVAITFLLLYFFGESQTDSMVRFTMISTIAAARTGAAMLISFLIFIIMAAYPKDQSDFSRSFFMTHKALFIALIYGIVIMAGSSSVAGAIQALLYHDMSEKVYMYLGTITGFLAFTIFLGYFPDFCKGAVDEHREIAQKQPRFIEILLGYIMIPILLALTVVLLLWSGRTIMTGTWPEFVRLAGIATAYSFGGLWLHIMVTHHVSGLAKFYRRVYPFAALIILAFEAAALVVQLGKFGLKGREYWFIVVWIVAVAAAILLALIKARAHIPIIVLVCSLAVISVLPWVGYHVLPVTLQIDRLERLLTTQGMLDDNKMIPATGELELSVRESITDAVYYLIYAEGAKLPDWISKDLTDPDEFEDQLGFKPAWPSVEEVGGGYLGTSLQLKTDAIDISGYQWGVPFQGQNAEITGENGVYNIVWDVKRTDGVPSLKIKLDGNVILEEDMNGYIDRISDQYPPGIQGKPTTAPLKDMSYIVENDDVTVLLVFNHVEINVDPQSDRIYYWLELDTIYLKEKQ